MMTDNDPFDPNHPDPLRARGSGKRPFAWRGRALAFAVVGGLLTAWLVTR